MGAVLLPRERFYVEVAPGYVRLRHQLGLRTKFGRRRLGPLWITLTYPGDWRKWVPDGATLERHRRAVGEAWFRTFDERPVGF